MLMRAPNFWSRPSLPVLSDIVAFNATSGNFTGLLLDPNILQLQINGLWGLGFGNGG